MIVQHEGQMWEISNFRVRPADKWLEIERGELVAKIEKKNAVLVQQADLLPIVEILRYEEFQLLLDLIEWGEIHNAQTASLLKSLALVMEESNVFCITNIGRLVAAEYARLNFPPLLDETMPIVCSRDKRGDTIVTGVAQNAVWHSPTGFEWGYAGSGPADFALNILHTYFCHRRFVGESSNLYRGQAFTEVCLLHQHFKSQIVAALPTEGGTIAWTTVQQWVRENASVLVQQILGFYPTELKF